MNTPVYLILIGTACGLAHAKSDESNNGILSGVIREQMQLIKYCMSTRCPKGQGHGNEKPEQKKVAFYAFPSKHLQDIPANTKIIFDRAPENIGRAYDPKTGVFVVPSDGVYVFHWTTTVHLGKYFATVLKVNNEKKAANHGYANGFKNSYSPSRTYLGHLNKGDKVWLSTDHNTGQYLFGGSHQYTSFSGYRL